MGENNPACDLTWLEEDGMSFCSFSSWDVEQKNMPKANEYLHVAITAWHTKCFL